MFKRWIGAAFLRSSGWVMNLHSDYKPDEASYVEFPLFNDSDVQIGTVKVSIVQFTKFHR